MNPFVESFGTIDYSYYHVEIKRKGDSLSFICQFHKPLDSTHLFKQKFIFRKGRPPFDIRFKNLIIQRNVPKNRDTFQFPFL